MKRRYGLYIFIILIFIAGTGISILNYFYPFSFVNKLFFRYNYSLDPDVELEGTEEYIIELWYPPFYRTIPLKDNENVQNKVYDKRKSFFLETIREKVAKKYPNITIKTNEVSFKNSKNTFEEAIEKGQPPDIYFFTGYDQLLDTKYQIPVERYIKKEDRSNFFSINWNNLEKKNNHLWVIPVALQKQVWYGKKKLSWPGGVVDELISWHNFRRKKLVFYTDDELLLRQLLTLKMDNYYHNDDKFSEEFYEELAKIFYWLDELRNHHILLEDSSICLRELMKNNVDICGPANPWLGYFIENKGKNLKKIELKSQINTMGLSIFHKKGEKNSKKVKAKMEVALIISKELGRELNSYLGLESAYRNMETKKSYNYKEIFQVAPKQREEWEKVLRYWYDFWSGDFDADEISQKFRNTK